MEAVCLTQKYWTRVMAPSLLAGLPKMGVWKNFPREMVYSPLAFQGLGFNNPYLWQQLLHVRTLIQEGGKDTITGKLLSTTIEQLRLEVGYDGPFSSIPKELLAITTGKVWIRDIIEFLKDLEMFVDDPIQDLLPQRTKDKFVMREFFRQDTEDTNFTSSTCVGCIAKLLFYPI